MVWHFLQRGRSMRKTLILSAAFMALTQAAVAAESTTTVSDCVIQEVLPGKDMTGTQWR